MVSMWDEDGIGRAVEAGKDVGAEVVNGTDEVRASHQEVGEEETDQNGADPGAYETWNSACYQQPVFHLIDNARPTYLPLSS